MSEIAKLAAYNQRRKDSLWLKIIMTILWVVYLAIISYLYASSSPLASPLIAAGYLGVLVTFFWYIRHVPTESFEIEVCSQLSKASELLKLSMQEKGRTAEKHRKKAAYHIKNVVTRIERWVSRTENSEIVEKSMHGRLSTFTTNLQRFVIPKIVLGEDLTAMRFTLEDLTRFFGDQWESLGIAHLDEVNKNLENSKPPSKGIRTLRSALQDFYKSKPVVIGFSLLIGFGLATTIVILFCTAVSLDFVVWTRTNLNVLILGGIGLSALVSQAFLHR